MSRPKYPRIKELGLKIRKVGDLAYVRRDELHKALGDKSEQFSELFGVQTCCAQGPYPWDVEAVLERMATGRLTGTQLNWD